MTVLRFPTPKQPKQRVGDPSITHASVIGGVKREDRRSDQFPRAVTEISGSDRQRFRILARGLAFGLADVHRCTSCGVDISHHANHHVMCRRCYGYEKLWRLSRQVISDITAERP